MTAHELRTLLFSRGMELSTLANKLAVKRQFVSAVVSGARPRPMGKGGPRTRRVQEAIAQAVGLSPDTIFPITSAPSRRQRRLAQET